MDHHNKKTTYTDPRLATPKEEKQPGASFRQRFDASTNDLQILHGKILHGKDLTDKVAVITGASSGIGLEVARALSHHGCLVVMASRNQTKAQKATQRIQAERSQAKCEYMHMDLSSLASVKQFVMKLRVKFSTEEAATPKKAPEEAAEKSPVANVAEEVYVKNVRNPIPFLAAPKMKSTLFLFLPLISVAEDEEVAISSTSNIFNSSTVFPSMSKMSPSTDPQKIKDLFCLVSARQKHSLHMNFSFNGKSKFTFFWAGENYGSTKLSENFSGTTFLNPSGESFSCIYKDINNIGMKASLEVYDIENITIHLPEDMEACQVHVWRREGFVFKRTAGDGESEL